MRESDIEDYLVKSVKQAGGEIRKVQWIGRNGAPDRIAFFPDGSIVLVELKAPGKKPEPHQLREHKKLRGMQTPISVIDSLYGVDDFISCWLHGYGHA